MAEAGAGVDIDMTAHRHCAEAAALADQRLRAIDHRRRTCHCRLFHRQPLTQAVHRLMRVPTVADEAFVQVDVAVDQPGQHREALQIDAFRPIVGPGIAIEPADTAITDMEVQRCTVAVDTAVDELQGHRELPERQDWRHRAPRHSHRPTKYLDGTHSPER